MERRKRQVILRLKAIGFLASKIVNDTKNKNYVAATTAYRESDEIRYVQGEVIPPATTADVRTPGKALDTDDMLLLIGVMAGVLLVLIGARGIENDWAITSILAFWAVFMAIFIVLLLLIQSRTLVQILVTFFHAANERFRLWCQSKLADRHYAYMEFAESEQTKRHDMSEETKRITAQAQIAEQQLTIRRIADSATGSTQSHSNLLANYSPEPTQPYVDLFKADVLSYLIELTETDERGTPRYVTTGGRICSSFPWSTRGDKFSEAERFWKLLKLAENTAGEWVVKQKGKVYFFNVDKFDKHAILDTFARISSDKE